MDDIIEQLLPLQFKSISSSNNEQQLISSAMQDGQLKMGWYTDESSFIGYINDQSPNLSKRINQYISNNAESKVKLQFKIMYHHMVTEQNINCPNMVRLETKDPMKCSIYAMLI